MSKMTAFAAAIAWALLVIPRLGEAAEAVTLQLSGPATFEFAGYYAALWQGYYRQAGLDVTIRPGGQRDNVPIDPVREVAENRAQFGIGSMQLVIRRAQGLPVTLLAPIFQQSGAAVYYRADSDFSSPAALVNARIGRLPASDILDIELATALRAEGIDPDKTKSVPLKPDQAVTALAGHTIDAAIGSAWMVPWQAHERGIVLKSFNPANYRVEYYGDSLFTMERVLLAERDSVERFRAASLKGCEYALEHPDEMIGRLVADKPGEPPIADIAGFNRYQADVARRLARYPEMPIGYSNGDRWTQIEAGMIGAGVLARSVDLTSFVYNPAPELPRADGGGRPAAPPVIMLIGAVVFATLAWFSRDLWQRLARLRLSVRRPRAPAAAIPERDQSTPAADIIITVPRRPMTVPAPTPSLPPIVNLNDVLAPLERRIRQRVRGKVRCRFSLFDALWPCRTEGGPAAACVLDLVAAATAVMDSDGMLIVGTRNFAFRPDNIADYGPGARLGEFARITVRDNGPGLSDEESDHIFDPQTTSRPAIAAAVAVMERLGGFVRVESAEGVGTAVHLYFARVDAAAPSEEPPAAQVAE
ncbi:MAG TPA: ABC transporter substrate-binding protein [Stellaceae bacterium]|nr:ABC transporter substrate-binding protein [Stellaceae bacterium]